MESMKNYGKHSTVQKNIVTQGLPYLQASLEKLDSHAFSLHPSTNIRPFSIADYGSSSGENSREAIDAIVSHVLQHSKQYSHLFGNNDNDDNIDSLERPEFLVSHTDLPSNNWSTLFQNLEKSPYNFSCSSSSNDFVDLAPNKQQRQPKIFTAAYGRSFFEQILPSNSVDVGISFTALHFLSRAPVLLQDHIFHKFSPIQDERNDFKEQARKDWKLFLENRAKELRPGGHLLVSLVTSDDCDSIYKLQELEFLGVLDEVVRLAQHEKIITQEERSALTLPAYYRTRDELETDIPSNLKVEVVSDLLPFSFHTALQEQTEELFRQQQQQSMNGCQQDNNVGQNIDEDVDRKQKHQERARIFANLNKKAGFAILENIIKSKLQESRGQDKQQEIRGIIDWMKEKFIETHMQMFSSEEALNDPIPSRFFSTVIVFRKLGEKTSKQSHG